MKELTVLELTRYLKDKIESDHLLANLWVRGEISNFKLAASGHVYFTLKDRDSCIRTVMFRSRARHVAFSPTNGMAVRVRGYVTVFERDGQYQLYAEDMEPDGEGALYAAFEKLKAKLADEGLFDRGRKKQLPRFPGCIGIVTSPTGAAIRDMINILHRRWPAVQILLAPVAVQGENAPLEVARAIGLLNRTANVDLLIVGRGGGSLEELWAFNTEVVARSIAASRLPIISAVGHETDFTIADLVADLRAPTPSAAAEIAVPDRSEVKRNVMMLRVRLTRGIKQQTGIYRQCLDRCTRSRVLTRPAEVICDRRRLLVDWQEKQLHRLVGTAVGSSGNRLAVLSGRLNALSPLAVLSRGYSFTTGPGGQVLRQAKQVHAGELITVHLHQGALECLVQKINANKKE